ncbi:MAG: GNAT family N-acetyltransferase [Flavobacteriales bacterium]
MIQSLNSERLVMRPFQQNEAALILRLDSDPKVMKYLGLQVMTEIEEAQKVIDALLTQYKAFGIGRYVVELKETGEFIGWAGLKYMDKPINSYQGHYDLGYRFSAAHWGKGYATEAAKAWLELADGEAQLAPVHAYTDENHQASQHVLLKCGFSLGGRFHDGFGWCRWLNRTPSDH